MPNCCGVSGGAMTYRRTIHSTPGMVLCLLTLLACQAALAAEHKRVLVQRRIQSSFLTEKDTVASVAADFPAIITNILQVLPDTKTVAVVMGDSPNERYWLEVLRKEYATFADRVSFIWFNNMSFADI